MATCTGNPTFNELYPNSFSEWPAKIPGFICKTPPFGPGSSSRFAQCCSGTVYNITSATLPDDPAYPMSCATFCQISPALNEANERYPYRFSEHFMCLTDGLEEESGEVACATNPVEGASVPTSYPSTPAGEWMTRSYSLPPRPSDFDSWTDAQVYTSSSSAGPETSASTPTKATSSSSRATGPEAAATTNTAIPNSGSRSSRRIVTECLVIATLLFGLSSV